LYTIQRPLCTVATTDAFQIEAVSEWFHEATGTRAPYPDGILLHYSLARAGDPIETGWLALPEDVNSRARS